MSTTPRPSSYLSPSGPAKEGEAPLRAHLPRSLSAQAPARVPRNQNVEGSRHRWALAAAFSPVPCRRKFQQGAEPNNERPSAWFPLSGINCQYGNVRAPLRGLALRHVTKVALHCAQNSLLHRRKRAQPILDVETLRPINGRECASLFFDFSNSASLAPQLAGSVS